MQNNVQLYPLKFTPISKYRMWGGNKLNEVLNKGFDGENNGESWEISAVPGDETQVTNGFLKGQTLPLLIQNYKDQLLGKAVYQKYGADFPLLIKFIDAKTPLSIQVHPHDEIAKERHQSFGKNEMWYVMDADVDAEIIVGFNQHLDKEQYQEYLAKDTVLEVMNVVKTKTGDVFNIPTGRIHAIGAGVLLAEIQQTSDITYRIYDYNRVDQSTGKTRALHNELALDVLDFEVHPNYKTQYENKLNQTNQLVHTPYFKTNLLNFSEKVEKNYTSIDSFVIYICTSGSLDLIVEEETYSLVKGETILLPANVKSLTLQPHSLAEILEVYC